MTDEQASAGLGSTASSPTSQSSAAAAMKVAIRLNERDIIKLIIEFMANREFHIAMLDLERETGVVNGAYSDDVLFLRQLILDGQWDDAIEFIQPLRQVEAFESKQFYFAIMKHQYLELLCLKTESNAVDNKLSVDQLTNYLNELSPYCPSDDEYKVSVACLFRELNYWVYKYVMQL